MATKTLLTVDEFLRLPEPLDCFYELVEGELITVSPEMFLHNEVRDNLLILLKTFAEAHRLGTVVSGQLFHLFGNTVRFPDVAFVRSGRTLPPDKLPEGAPDLAIEVVSPDDSRRYVREKALNWLAEGAIVVVVLDPRTCSATVYREGQDAGVFTDGELDLSDAVPGWRVAVADFFA